MGFWDTVTSKLNDVEVKNAESKIGSLGEIPFQVTSDDVYTLNNMQRSYAAKYVEHEVIGEKPVLEFTGANLRTISFDIQIHAEWGHNPKDEIQKLVDYCEQGQVLTFILGNGPVGDNKWVIESVSETDEMFVGNGEVLYCKASISLKEYVSEAVKQDENT